jgi:amino acid transporter
MLLLAAAAAGMLGGGFLIGLWAVGCVLIVLSLAVAVFAVLRDWPESGQPGVHVVPGQSLSVADVLERARAA